jgi:hypothetical protein
MNHRKKTRRRPQAEFAASRKLRVEVNIRDSCLQMLMPLAGILLRAGVGAGEFSDLCRHAYVRVAANQLALVRRKTNVSRIAVATGLTRQEVARLLKSDTASSRREPKQLHRANRVLGGWYSDPRFTLRSGVPKPLLVRGSGLTFHRLVRQYGGDVPPRAVLDELRRADAVRTLRTGTILPVRRSVEYGVRSQRALREGAQKLRLLAETLHHNLDYPAATLFEDVAVSNPLRAEHFPIAVRRLSVSAKRFLSATRHYLGREERQETAKRRASKLSSIGVGVFLFSRSV